MENQNPNFKLAEKKNEDGNKCANNHDFVTARILYTEAIGLCPDVAKYYSNRALCHLKLKRLSDSFDDCKMAQQKDPTFIKAYVREANYYIAKGEFGAALIALEKVKVQFPEDEELHEMVLDFVFKMFRILAYLKDKEAHVRQIMSGENIDCKKAMSILEEIMVTAVDCTRLKIIQAECLAHLGNSEKSKQLLREIQSNTSIKDPDVLYVEGLLYYFDDHLEDAKSSLRDVIRIAPDFQKAKTTFKNTSQVLALTKAVETALQENNYQVAYSKCIEALNIKIGLITAARLLTLHGKIFYEEGLFSKTIEKCGQALHLNKRCAQAYFLRAKSYAMSKKYDKALFDYEQVCILDNTKEKEQLFDETAKLFEATLTSDLKYLNASEKDTKDKIRKRFCELSKKYHPDHHMKSPRKDWFANMYRNILEAYGRIDKPVVPPRNVSIDENSTIIKTKVTENTPNEVTEEIDLRNLEISVREIFQQKKPDYPQALKKIKLLLEDQNEDWLIRRKLECLLYLEKLEKAEELLRTFSMDSKDEEMLFFRGLLLFYQDRMEEAKNVFNAVKKIAPDYVKLIPFLKAIQHVKNQENTAQTALRGQDFSEAIQSYNTAIALDSIGQVTKSNLHHSKAKAQYESKQFKDAIRSCSSALKIVPNAENVLITRAESHLSLNNFDKAALDYSYLYKITRKKEYEIPLSDVVKRCNQTNKTFYELVGLKQTASAVEIQRKFDRLIRRLYDGAQDGGLQMHWFYERFQLCQEALKTLLDVKSRAAYDKKLCSGDQNTKPKVKNYYTILNAMTTDSQEEIQKKYIHAIKSIHPDHTDPAYYTVHCNEIQEAFRVLSDPTMRQHYHRENKNLFN